MPPLAWLAMALLAGIGAYLVAWPAWQSSRTREARDTNAERYLAWRGRAVRGAPQSRPMSSDERRRLVLGAALGAVAVLALVAFFATS